MIELYENMSSDAADLCGLILKASGIPFRVKKSGGGWGIWVEDRDYPRARRAVEQYCRENRPPEAGMQHLPEGQAHGYAGVWAAALLAVCYFFAAQAESVHVVWDVFGASARKIVGGELYRTVTALMLHVDTVHLVGNMAGLAIFATAVCQVAGWGAGMLMVLFAGSAGNLVNAMVRQSGHLSIGASTAVFGAIGILSGYQFLRKRNSARRTAAWLPLACGLALLGFLGAGAHVDLTAHLFGFMIGIFVGIGYAMTRKTIGPMGQGICLGVAVAAAAGAWAAGIWMHY